VIAALGCGNGGDDAGEAKRAPVTVAGLPGIDVAKVADRVEALRGLEFDRLPKAQVVSEKKLARQLRDAERAAVRADPDRVDREERSAAAAAALLFLSGVIDSDSELTLIASGDTDIGGVYLPEQGRIYVVRQEVRRSRRIAETIIAHELVHALEDQSFELDDSSDPVSDMSDARQALAEGSATVAEAQYGSRNLETNRTARDLLGRHLRRLRAEKAPAGLRPAIGFPYIAGADFVTALLKRGGWKQVTEAGQHPPTTTEQILHPAKYLDGEGAERVQIEAGTALGKGWRRVGRADLGELSTRMVLAAGLPRARADRAAAGWAGGSFEVWYRRRLPGIRCSQSCRKQASAVLAWKWDDAAEAREFARAVRAYLPAALQASRSGRDTWSIPDGSAAFVARGSETTLTFAPGERLAKRLAAG
jgi:hypothetical protein